MGLHGTTSGGQNGSSSDDASRVPASSIDRTLVEAGRRLRPSELRELARRLEQLESTLIGPGASGFFAPEEDDLPQQQPQPAPHVAHGSTVRYEPVNLHGAVDLASMVSGISLSPSESSSTITSAVDPPPSDDQVDGSAATPLFGAADQPHEEAAPAPTPVREGERAKKHLLYLLVTCAECIQHGETALANEVIMGMRHMLGRVGVGSGLGRVASHFIDALSRRLRYPPTSFQEPVTADWAFFFYHHFYEACPFIKASHLSANQAILDAFHGCDRVHIIDLNLQHGLQWPALMQALALGRGGPPAVRLTGVSFPYPAGRAIPLQAVGEWLTEQARSVGVEEFAFRGVAITNKLEDVERLVDVPPGEALAVNSVMQLHRLLRETDGTAGGQPIDTVLAWIRRLTPNIMTLVENDAAHNAPMFVDRFRETLSYYCCMFECLEVEQPPPQPRRVGLASVAAETYLRREIINIVSCEEDARVERHEPHAMWKWRLRAAGFRPAPLPSDSLEQARMLLGLCSGGGSYTMSEPDGCLTLGWRHRPLMSTSAWTVEYPAATSARTYS